MSSLYKFSLTTAVLININIILGQGIFVNTALLAKHMGSVGALAYLAVGITIIPIIFAFAQLMKNNSSYTLFDHVNKAFGRVPGFIASFGFSIGKLGTATLAVHVCNMIAQLIIPELAAIPILYRNIFAIGVFVSLNLLNLKMGARIQATITTLKTIPNLFGVVGGLYAFSLNTLIINANPWALPQTFSFALFAFSGFEATLTIIPKLKDSRDGLKAVLLACTMVVVILCLYQTMFSGALGQALINSDNWLEAYKTLSIRLVGDNMWAQILTRIMTVGVASSAFGSGYSIMFSGGWNVHDIAKHNLLPFSHLFTRLSRSGAPILSVFMQGIICVSYILLSHGSQIPMQQMSVLGTVITYPLIVMAFTRWAFCSQSKLKIRLISIAALVSSTLFIATFIQNIMTFGAWPLLIFAIIMLPLSLYAGSNHSSSRAY